MQGMDGYVRQDGMSGLEAYVPQSLRRRVGTWHPPRRQRYGNHYGSPIYKIPYPTSQVLCPPF